MFSAPGSDRNARNGKSARERQSIAETRADARTQESSRRRAPTRAAERAATGPAPFPPAVCIFQLLRAFLRLNLIKKKKVTGDSYVKCHALQLLFGTFFDICYRSRDISEKSFLGVVFCIIRGELGVFGTCNLHHRF